MSRSRSRSSSSDSSRHYSSKHRKKGKRKRHSSENDDYKDYKDYKYYKYYKDYKGYKDKHKKYKKKVKVIKSTILSAPKTVKKTKCLGVFGLAATTTEDKIHEIFSKYGKIRRINVIFDTKTGKSRGYAFLYFKHLKDATDAKEALSGMEIDNRRVRVDYSITSRPHEPTPGIYKGRSTRPGVAAEEVAENSKTRSPKREDFSSSSSESRSRSITPPRKRRHRHRTPSRSPSFSSSSS